jgi:HD superfamily phosphohydrolase
MLNKKTTLLTDSLHGPIPLAPFEKRLISTEAYNRLHNILQNSTVYFTYPSNRTSRFIHSIGCTKIAGEIFRNSLLNAQSAQGDDLKIFLNKAQTVVDNLWVQEEFSDDLRHKEINAPDLTLKELRALNCHFYSSNLLPAFQPHEEYLFVLFFQAVRLVALLHDIGHPPFSHVAEFALTSIYELIKPHKTGSPESPSPDPGSPIAQIRVLFQKYFRGPSVFHESLGQVLAKYLLDQAIIEVKNELRKSGVDNPKLLHDLVTVKYLTLAILKDVHTLEDESFFKGLHTIVDGDLDADRLDYVQRDLATSGMARDPFQITRLLQSFTLKVSQPDAAGLRTFGFVPSVRALHTIENFYTQRFQLYKYVVYHHRVVKFDALMEKSIYALSVDFLKNSGVLGKDGKPLLVKGNDQKKEGAKAASISNENEENVTLPYDISGLWQVMQPDVAAPFKFVNYYIQWDDAWLLSVLRTHYFRLKRKSQGQEGMKQQIEVRLEELLSNKKKYHALYKRGECFLEIDRAFLTAFSPSFNWSRLRDDAKTKSKSLEVELLQKYVEDAKTLLIEGKNLTGLIEANGYVLARLRAITWGLGFHGRHEVPFAQTAADEIGKGKTGLPNQVIKDVIFMPKWIKPGVAKEMSLVDSEGKIVALGAVSRVADELERAALLFPPFFVFLYGSEDISEENFHQQRQEFGQLLWMHFDSWISNKYNRN